MPAPILIDTDTGVDDALALIIALRSPELSVKAITTVAGNVGVNLCTRNVLRVLAVLGCAPGEIPVAEGAARPLKRPLTTAPEVHGSDGLGGLGLRPVPIHQAVKRNAVQTILDLCDRLPNRLTIVALGPLTNIARAWLARPRSLRKVRRIISMGGAFSVPGNTGPAAEFNYYVDPEAAQIILRSGLPLRVVPLDVTEQTALARADVVRRARKAGRVGRFIAAATRSYMEYHRRTEGFHGGFLHDPLAVAVAVDRSLVRWKRALVSVETMSPRGKTNAQDTSIAVRTRPRVEVAVKVDVERALRFMHARWWD